MLIGIVSLIDRFFCCCYCCFFNVALFLFSVLFFLCVLSLCSLAVLWFTLFSFRVRFLLFSFVILCHMFDSCSLPCVLFLLFSSMFLCRVFVSCSFPLCSFSVIFLVFFCRGLLQYSLPAPTELLHIAGNAWRFGFRWLVFIPFSSYKFPSVADRRCCYLGIYVSEDRRAGR